MTECKVDGCDRAVTVKKHQLCRTHYRTMRAGRPLEPIKPYRLKHKDNEGRVCVECDKYKPWSEFYRYSKTKSHMAMCKECHSEKARAWYQQLKTDAGR